MQLKKLLIQATKILGFVVAIIYPFAVFAALHHDLSVRFIGLALVAVVLIGMARHKNLWLGLCGIALAAIAFFSNQKIFLKLYPVLMNFGICLVFALSLTTKPIVQRFAEKMKYSMSDAAKLYARRATIAWAIFMGANTVISLATVFMGDAVWMWYNGLISYCLIGIMMGAEYLIRKKVAHV